MCRMRDNANDAVNLGLCVLCAARGGADYCEFSRSEENITSAQEMFPGLIIASESAEKPMTTKRPRGYYRAQRKRIIKKRFRFGAGLQTVPGKCAKISPLANDISLNPRRIFKGQRSLSLQERRAFGRGINSEAELAA